MDIRELALGLVQQVSVIGSVEEQVSRMSHWLRTEPWGPELWTWRAVVVASLVARRWGR